MSTVVALLKSTEVNLTVSEATIDSGATELEFCVVVVISVERDVTVVTDRLVTVTVNEAVEHSWLTIETLNKPRRARRPKYQGLVKKSRGSCRSFAYFRS